MADDKEQKLDDKPVQKEAKQAEKPKEKELKCSGDFFRVCTSDGQQFFVRKDDVTLTTADAEGTSIVLHSGKIIVVKESLEEVNKLAGIAG